MNFLEYSKLPDDNDIDNDDHENRELALCLQENRTEYKIEDHLLR